MKKLLIIPMACLMACSSVKKSGTQVNDRALQDIETLSSDKYEGRKTGTKGNEMAREYIKTRFKELGLSGYTANYEQDFSFTPRNGNKVDGKNVVAYIAGKTSDVIVISAHYDHVGVRDNKIYNGADDNASGTAALLYFAEYFSRNKPNNTLIFAAFDAEEMGLQGAKAFVAAPPVPLANIKLNINMDMIAHNDKNELYVAGTFYNPKLKDYILTTVPNIRVIAGHDDPKMGSDDWTSQSDQGAFFAKNIPFLYFGVEDHKDYHQPTDDFENINKQFFTDAKAAILEIVNNIDKGRTLQTIFKEKVIMNKQ